MALITDVNEPEQVFARLPSSEFTRERYVVESDLPSHVGLEMLELKGWICVGWAYSKEVSAIASWRYVCMFEREGGGPRYWSQVTRNVFEGMALIMKRKSISRR